MFMNVSVQKQTCDTHQMYKFQFLQLENDKKCSLFKKIENRFCLLSAED